GRVSRLRWCSGERGREGHLGRDRERVGRVSALRPRPSRHGQRGRVIWGRGGTQPWADRSQPGCCGCARGPRSRRGSEAAPRATGRPSRRRDLPGQRSDLAQADHEVSPMLESATLRLHLSGTLERADGRAILWLPYRAGAKARTREVNIDAPSWAVVGYSRAQAVAEKAVLPVTFGALDGEASWLEGGKTVAAPPRVGPHRLSSPYPTETTRPALFTALRTGFALELLAQAFKATRELRTQRRS